LYFDRRLALKYFLNLGKEQWRMSWGIDIQFFFRFVEVLFSHLTTLAKEV